MRKCFSLLVLGLSFSLSASVSTHSTDTKKVEIKKAKAFNLDYSDVFYFSPAILTETAEVTFYGSVVQPAIRLMATDFVATKFNYPLARCALRSR